MQFILENRLNGCQIFGRFRFLKPNANRISVFRTSLVRTLFRGLDWIRSGVRVNASFQKNPGWVVSYDSTKRATI